MAADRKIKVSAEALEFDDLVIPLAVRRHAAARRISLRIDVPRRGAVLTLPPRSGLRAGLDFVAAKAAWLRGAYARIPAARPFAPGAEIPVFGRRHRIEHRAGGRGGVWREGEAIVVAGAEAHLARRLADWLKRESQRELDARTRAKAAAIGRRVARVAVRDTRSRWGSCARDGRVNYSWRLVFAPDFVVDYVVAHEVAHLAYLSHGPRFKTTLDRLTPHRAEAEAWLRREGPGLLLYGASFG